MTKIRPQDGN